MDRGVVIWLRCSVCSGLIRLCSLPSFACGSRGCQISSRWSFGALRRVRVKAAARWIRTSTYSTWKGLLPVPALFSYGYKWLFLNSFELLLRSHAPHSTLDSIARCHPYVQPRKAASAPPAPRSRQLVVVQSRRLRWAEPRVPQQRNLTWRRTSAQNLPS
jgi:hypothetical protein